MDNRLSLVDVPGQGNRRGTTIDDLNFLVAGESPD